VEKLPLILLAALASAAAIQAQIQVGAVVAVEAIPPGARAANAVVSYAAYVGKVVWPARLGVFYPHRESSLPTAQVVATGAVLVLVTAAALRAARRAPYLAVGWLWYLGTLLPVIGIVQVGTQAMADRYAYVPAIGLFIALAWGAAALASRRPLSRVLAVAAAAALLALAGRTSQQLRVWRDSLSLFAATIAAVPDSWVAHYNLGNALMAAGRTAEAEARFRETVRLRPRFARGHNNLGDALDGRGRHEEAVAAYQEAIRVNPDLAEAHNNLGTALAALGRLEQAEASLREALRRQPEFVEAWFNLGITLRRLGRLGQSGEALSRAVLIRPDFDRARFQRAITAAQAGDLETARRDLDVLRGRDAELSARLAAALQQAAGANGTPGPGPAPPGTR
jgi:tetratricopeptide (TPR) repeat protein